ncbi:MAG: prephenate dehydrogenase [Firmicutes bacterium]|nr:prephenate dehydrogenase [Bacillota bacterium]
MTVSFGRVAIIGVGMVGGSLGKAMLTRELAREIVGFDTSSGVLQQALSLGAVTRQASSLQEAVLDADLVVLAAPVLATLQLLSEIAPFLTAGTLVTDVCSTKEAVALRAAESLPTTVSFIGGHPMSGSEKEGVAALDENLFENAFYLLTGQSGLERMEALVRELGAVPLVLQPQKHDQLVAAVSHLPHVAATALVQAVAGLHETDELLVLAASGFRDTTRVAMGSPHMWKDICLSNRENIVTLLDLLVQELQSVRRLVAASNTEGLLTHFQQARTFRQQVPLRGKGILPLIYNLYVYVPDQPGIIGEVTGLVGKGGVNIAEIELLRMREEEGGPLRVGFMSAEGSRLAARVLETEGFRVEMQEG